MTTIEIPPLAPDRAGLFFREKNGGEPPADAPDVENDLGTDIGNDKSLLCSRCRTVITSSRHETAIDGNHHHTFFNPAGVIYEIRCFRRARGCVIHGQPTSEFSWFKGYVWQYAVCVTCSDHLGWFFNSADMVFFGIITTKLVAE